MKKILSFLLSIMMIFSFSSPTHAKEKLVISSSNIQKLDPYVKVINNEFVLDLPDNIYLDENDFITTQRMIAEANKIVRENNLTIHPETKTAIIYGVQTRAWGKNDIEFHWNFARVYIDAGNLRIALTAGVGGLGGALGFLVTSGWGAAAIGAASAALGIAANNITHGIWFDYNYILGVTACGLQ